MKLPWKNVRQNADVPGSFTSPFAMGIGYGRPAAGPGNAMVSFNAPSTTPPGTPMHYAGGGGPYPDPGAVSKQPWYAIRTGYTIAQKGLPEVGSFGRRAAGLPPAGAYGTRGPNIINPLFGRPGFTYAMTAPSPRVGPVLKGAPGSGATGAVEHSRALGMVSPAFLLEQHIGMEQFDYSPPTVADVHIDIPRVIRGNKGEDGFSMIGTYRAHDFTPADRFFMQNRSSGNWQDMTFGPDYRFLLPQQQVAKYNLYNDIALSRQLSPDYYQLTYQTSPQVAASIGGGGSFRPLGY